MIALTRQLYPRLSRIIASSLHGGGEDAEEEGIGKGAGGKGSAGEAVSGESGVLGRGDGEQGGEQEVAAEGGVEGCGELRGDEEGDRSEKVLSSAREKDESLQGSSSSTGCDVSVGDGTGGDGVGRGDIMRGTERGEAAGRGPTCGPRTTAARGRASEGTGGGVGNSGSAMVLLVGLLTACLRNARLPHSRRHCLLLLHAAAQHCSHAVCLQAVAPFLVAVLAPDGLTATPLHALDTLLPGGAASPPLVRCTALTVLTRLLARVRCFPSTDARFFPEYLFPSLSLLPRSPDETVRATLALCLPSLAASALRFLLLPAGATCATGGSEGESGQGANEGERKSSSTAWEERGGGETDGDNDSSSGMPGFSLATSGLPPSQRVSSCATLTSLKALAAAAERLAEQHMGELAEVREAVRVAVEELSTLPRSTPPIRLSLLHHAPSLAVFLGPPLATTALLPLLITFLNDPSPRVRAAFFHTLPALCPHVAPSALPAFLLPCLEQALGDTSHSSVPAAAAACLAQLVRSQRLQQRRWLLSAARHAAPLLRHPEGDVRGAAVAFAAAAAGLLSAVDAHALLLPLLSPSLRYRPALLTSPASLAAALKAPLSTHPALPPQPPLPAQAGVASWQMSAGQAVPDLRVPHALSPAAARETEAGRAAAGARVSVGEHGSNRGVGAMSGEDEQGADTGAVGRGEGGAADMQGKRSVGQEEGRDVAMGGQAASGRAAAAAAQHVASSTLAHSLSMQYAVPPAHGAAPAAPYPAMAAALASMRTDTGQPWPPLPSTAPWPATTHSPASTAHWPSTPLHTPLPASASHSLLVPPPSPSPPLHLPTPPSPLIHRHLTSHRPLISPLPLTRLTTSPLPPPTSSALSTSHSASHPSLPPPTTPHAATTPTSTPTSLPPSHALPPHTGPLLPHTLRGPPPPPPPPAPVSHSLVFLGTTQPHTRISSLSLSLRSSRRPPSSSTLRPSASPARHTLPPAVPAAGPATMCAAEAGQGGRAEDEMERRLPAAGREGHTAALLERPRALAGGGAGGEVSPRAASQAQSSVDDCSAAHVNATSSATSASPHLVEPGGVGAGSTGHAQLPAAAQVAPPSAAGQAAGAEAEESRERRAAAVSGEVQRLLGWGSADDGAAMALLPASPSLLSTTAAAWRPRGVLVAQLHEHRAAVPALAVAGNSQWFATASHDGTVKVWDATRLDRGTAFRSKLTYAPGGAAVAGAGKATAVAVMGDSATAAVGYASGEVHVVHVDYAPRFLSSPDSYRCITRMASLEPASWSSPSSHTPGAARGPILSVHSWAASTLGATPPSLSASSSSLFSCNPLSSSHALLLVASLHGGITLWDMRAARPALSLHLHAALGAPTHVLPDPHHGLWLLAASSCSALCLWDLRFLLPLSSWRLPSAPSAPHPPPITALAPMLPAAFPPAGDAMGAAAAGGPEHLPGWFGADRGSAATKGAVGAAGGGAAAAGAGGAVGGASRPLVYVASGRDEVGLWSADTGQCHQPSSSTAPPPSLPSRSNLPTALQSRPHLLPLPPFSTSTTTPSGRMLSSSPCLPSGPLPQSTQSTQSSGASGARQARQSLLRVEQLKEPPGRVGGVRALLGVPGGSALLTAGTDCCIRYWCRLRPEQSGWVSGPTARGARGEVLHPRYDMRIVHGARVIQETPPPFYVDAARQRGSGTGASTPQAGGRAAAGSQGHADTGPGGAAGGGGGAGGGGRRSMVEVAAVDVGGCHRDAVLALAVADPGQRLLLSASRDGVVNVWR
ncbi:unnamed protein product [Closterium sp. NIES-65]|nr:unnamed protein product [Closterium sp. NIES-65]